MKTSDDKVCVPVQCRVQPPGQRWRCPPSLLSDGWPSRPNRSPEPVYTWETQREREADCCNYRNSKKITQQIAHVTVTLRALLWVYRSRNKTWEPLASRQDSSVQWFDFQAQTRRGDAQSHHNSFLDRYQGFNISILQLKLKTYDIK